MASVASRVFAGLGRRVAQLEPAVRAGGDSEALHDMRVAVRRARAALRVFEPYLPATQTRTAARALRRMGHSLGPARDSDVLMGNVQHRLKSFAEREQTGLAPLVAALQRDRASSRAVLERFLAGARSEPARRQLRLLSRPPPRASPPLGEAAPGVVAARIDAAQAALGRVRSARPRPTLLHDLRIRLKELRYALEFLRGAFGPAIAPILQRLREAQDELGAIQDTVVEESRVRIAAAGLGMDARGNRALGAMLLAIRRDRAARVKRSRALSRELDALLAKARKACGLPGK